MERKNRQFEFLKLLIAFLFTAVVLGLLFYYSPAASEELPQEISKENWIFLPEPDYKITDTYTSYPDWTLSIPEIEFNQQMIQIYKQGQDLPVPDNQPGFYLPNDSHIFIVGHNTSTFSRLNEIPKQIGIWKNKEQQTYNLVASEIKPVEEISMEQIFQFRGVVLMTCAGQKVGNKYTHRLILYYT